MTPHSHRNQRHAPRRVEHILVIDDKTRQDPFMQGMFSLLIPTGITIKICSISEAVKIFESGLSKPTMVIVKVPQTIKSLMDAGIDIDFVNIGGMGMSVGRKKFYQNIATSPEGDAILRELIGGVSGLKSRSFRLTRKSMWPLCSSEWSRERKQGNQL